MRHGNENQPHARTYLFICRVIIVVGLAAIAGVVWGLSYLTLN